MVDLAHAHLSAIEYLPQVNEYQYFNIGTGKGTSVSELVTIFQHVNEVKVPYSIVGRREGDLRIAYCDNYKAVSVLHWKPEKTVEDMCKDAWRFQLKNLSQ